MSIYNKAKSNYKKKAAVNLLRQNDTVYVLRQNDKFWPGSGPEYSEHHVGDQIKDSGLFPALQTNRGIHTSVVSIHQHCR
jgi:hypothetical protein